ncbi:MAG: hypothetical protein QM479_17470 [Pseudomonadota bacterium]
MKKISDRDKQFKELNILLGLAFSKEHSHDQCCASDCPDEEMIAAYFDNKLSIEEDKKFLKLLNHCPESYSLWLSMLETIEYTNIEKQATAQTATKKPILSFILDWLTTYQMSLTGAMATGFLFLFIINFTYTPFSQLPIDKQIVKIWQDSESLDLAYVDVSQYTTHGLTKSSFSIMPFPEKIAFSSGFKQGLINMSAVSEQVNSDNETLSFLNSLPDKALACDNKFCEKETHLNQQLGLWSSYVLQECQQNKVSQKKYWKKQNIVSQHFLQEYNTLKQNLVENEKYSNSLVKKVNKINDSLNNLISSKSPAIQSKQSTVCNNIKQLALSSIQAL